MEKQVPTVEVEIGKGEDLKKVVLYKWLTQEEEDNLNVLLLGNSDVNNGVEEVVLTAEVLVKMNRFLIENVCKSHKWEEINTWHPDLRKELLKRVEEVRSKN